MGRASERSGELASWKRRRVEDCFSVETSSLYLGPHEVTTCPSGPYVLRSRVVCGSVDGIESRRSYERVSSQFAVADGSAASANVVSWRGIKGGGAATAGSEANHASHTSRDEVCEAWFASGRFSFKRGTRPGSVSVRGRRRTQYGHGRSATSSGRLTAQRREYHGGSSRFQRCYNRWEQKLAQYELVEPRSGEQALSA